MLQQTQVQSALPYFERFLARFPDVRTLSRAPESEVLRLWSGLGYYSRARNLHKTAKIVQERHGGRFPGRMEEILELPGIGRYTAGAILSIAFDQPAPILDGNVRRILSRFYLEADTDRLWEFAGGIVSGGLKQGLKPSEVNQALMELGALVCSPKAPKCGVCPVQKSCGARRGGVQEKFPPARKAPAVVQEYHAVLVARRKNGSAEEYLIRRRSGEQRRFKNMWEFPTVAAPSPVSGPAALRGLAREFSERLGIPVRGLRVLGRFRHTVTRHDLRVWVVEGALAKKVSGAGLRWVRRDELGRFSFSSMLGKTLAVVPRI
jgi:A/G-specific adenine glycosylase